MFAESDRDQIDFRLLQNGSVSLFHNSDVLKQGCEQLRVLGYIVDEVFCRRGGFQGQMSLAMGFEWTGNLNALLDGLRYYPSAQSGKAALVLHDYHQLVSESPQLAWHVLDLIENASRDLLLEGKLLITMVQTDDAKFSVERIGGRSALWNPIEVIGLASE